MAEKPERCPVCDDRGWIEVVAGGPECCGGSDWECGAPGCTGPRDGRYLEQELCDCPAGHRLARRPTEGDR